MRFLFVSLIIILSSFSLLAGKNIDLSASIEANNSASKEYRIDLIIFKNNKISEKSLKEIFETPKNIDFASNLIEISKEPELLVTTQSVNSQLLIKEPQIKNLKPIVTKTNEGEFSKNQFLPFNYFEELRDSKRRISNIVAKLHKSKDFTIFYEASWYQPLLSKDLSIPIFINSSIEDEAIYGQIDFYQERYIHTELDIRLSSKENSNNSISININKYREIQDLVNADFIPKTYNFLKSLGTDFYEFGSKLIFRNNIKTENQKNEAGSIILKNLKNKYEILEERKMRNNDLHYFDHPHFGVLIRIEEWEVDS